MVNYISKKLINLVKKREGYTLIVLTVVLLVISLMLGLVLTINFSSQAKTLQFDLYRAQALYLAEAGIREVIWQLRYSQTPPQNPFYLEIEYVSWKGRVEVSRQINVPQQGKITITSTAKVPYNVPLEVQRKIRVVIDSTTFQIERWEEETLEYIE